MRSWKTPLALLLALLALTSYSAEAVAKPKPSKGAPGPVAGAGLPFLVAGGVYWLIRRRINRVGEESAAEAPSATDNAKI